MSAGWLYVRCLGWGLGTGAAVGGGFGLLLGLLAGIPYGSVEIVGLAAFGGLFYGAVVAVVPTVLGGIAVVVVLCLRHPAPASYEAVVHDLTVAFAAVVVVLDLVVLVWWAALGGLATLHVVVAVLAAVDGATVLMLKPARASIARGWSGVGHQAFQKAW